MPGPLPDPNHRRRNQPTVPTTDLPAGGRKGAAPKIPAGYELGEQGSAWWSWAWHTPQAAAWSKGDLYLIARRARLEDDVAALAFLGFDPPPTDDEELGGYLEAVKYVVERLKSLAGGELAVMKEMREIDTRLGLTPKGLADLRWKIVADEEKPAAGEAPLRVLRGGADPRASLSG